jgi:catechol 2,3-dioxygenase-like lactoylglutathione lyase family enzyme
VPHPPRAWPEYHPAYHARFFLDPDGNSVEAVHHETSRPGEIDHLWLRTKDVDAAKRFCAAVAPIVPIEVRQDLPDFLHIRFADRTGSFSFIAGETPTENVHLAFGVPDLATVERFHDAAISAGYRDNGMPAERPQYHPGYYGAFVRDPGTGLGSSEGGASWSPDSRMLAFPSDQTGVDLIYTVNADGTGLRRLTGSGNDAGLARNERERGCPVGRGAPPPLSAEEDG